MLRGMMEVKALNISGTNRIDETEFKRLYNPAVSRMNHLLALVGLRRTRAPSLIDTRAPCAHLITRSPCSTCLARCWWRLRSRCEPMPYGPR